MSAALVPPGGDLVLPEINSSILVIETRLLKWRKSSFRPAGNQNRHPRLPQQHIEPWTRGCPQADEATKIVAGYAARAFVHLSRSGEPGGSSDRHQARTRGHHEESQRNCLSAGE